MNDGTAGPDRATLQEQRRRFLDEVEPIREDLFRFCRALADSVWDAEDLLQDTLLRGFALLAERVHGVRDLRAYLHRTAANAWIDRVRRRTPVTRAPEDLPDPPAAPEPPTAEAREALGELARRLPPRERVAVLLRDAFGYTNGEVAAALRTTEGAAKAAVHRGRARLAAGPGAAPPPAVRERRRVEMDLLDELAAAFGERDVPRLVALMMPGGATDIVGVARDVPESTTEGTFVHTVAETGLVRATAEEVEGEALVVLWYADPEDAAAPPRVGDAYRVHHDGARVARLECFYYCPELLEAVAAALDARARPNGTRPA